MSATIRLTLNDQLEEGLSFLKKSYPFMSNDEILKLALSKFYAEEVNQIKERSVAYKAESINKQDGIDFKSELEMSEWWKKNKKELRENEGSN